MFALVSLYYVFHLLKTKQASSCGWSSTPVWLFWPCSVSCRSPLPTYLHTVKAARLLNLLGEKYAFWLEAILKMNWVILQHQKLSKFTNSYWMLSVCLFVLTVSGFWEDVLYHLGIVRYGNIDYTHSVIMYFYMQDQLSDLHWGNN